MPRSKLIDGLVWVLVPPGLVLWVAAQHRNSYFLYDEWVMLERVVAGQAVHQSLIGFNGHLWAVPYLVFHLQLGLFGAESSVLVFFALCMSLLALHVSAALVLIRLGVPTPVAVLAAALVTYFGPGAETMVLEYEFAANLALALSLFAAYVVLRVPVPRPRDGVAVSVLLVAAVACDSGIALVALPFTILVVVVAWSRRWAAIALATPLLVLLVWTVLDQAKVFAPDGCPNCWPATFSAPLGWSLRFGFALLAQAAGGLVGAGQGVGYVVLLGGLVMLVIAVRHHRVDRVRAWAAIGGWLSALTAVASVTYSRAGFWPTEQEAIRSFMGPSNRYVQSVALFLLLGLLPVVVRTVRWPARLPAWSGVALASAALIVVFVLNIPGVNETRSFYKGWSNRVRLDVQASADVLAHGCSSGSAPDPDAVPTAGSSPQITVGLVQDLLERGALEPSTAPPNPAFVDLICQPTT
ncbi:MAG: hypothetical protein ACJ739_08480 [Acidimicrobiales bacterium]